MKIDSIAHAEQILKTYVPNAKQYLKDGLSLERMWPMLAAAGNPHQKLKVVHIAGTSGKTSTAYYIAAILGQSGAKTGLTVSPHVDSVTERVQINGVPLADADFCRDLGEFLELISEVDSPSYFELLMVFILWEFVKHDVDYAVLETGLGGLLDSTNVVTREDKVCVITDIGLDHMQVLGNTIGEIASQKAGIIHEANQVVMYKQDHEAQQQIDARVSAKQATTTFVNTDDNALIATQSQLEQLPYFQRRNWLLAAEACKSIAERDHLQLQNLDPLSVVVPGRMEKKTLPDGSLLVMDGAHNGQKVAAFVDSYKRRYSDQKATVLIALKEGKEYIEVMELLAEITESMIVTSFEASQDLPALAQDPELLATYMRDTHGVEAEAIDDYHTALQVLLESDSDIKLIIGSFYLLGQLRPLLKA